MLCSARSPAYYLRRKVPVPSMRSVYARQCRRHEIAHASMLILALDPAQAPASEPGDPFPRALAVRCSYVRKKIQQDRADVRNS